MPVVISLLRAVNVGGHNKLPMDRLRELCGELGLTDVKTYVQSGNVVFRTREKNMTSLGHRMEDAIERTFGFRPDVINRTLTELREVVVRNPFEKRDGIDGSKLLVTFLAADPGHDAREKVRAIPTDPEELYIDGREIFIYFPNGSGRTRLPAAAIDKALKTRGTARNWNTVRKLLEMGEKLQ